MCVDASKTRENHYIFNSYDHNVRYKCWSDDSNIFQKTIIRLNIVIFKRMNETFVLNVSKIIGTINIETH